MPRLTTDDGTELYYKDWGAGRPVVLIHGWPLSADSWDDHALPIADAGYRVIAYDRRGFGRSEQPFTGYDYNVLAADLRAVLRQLDLDGATLVGFSMGGGEVARYMAHHHDKDPDRVAQTVLISSVVPYMLQTADNPKGVPEETFAEMSKAMREDRAAFFDDFFKTFFGVGLIQHPVSNEWLEHCRTVAMSASLKATLACAGAFATTDFRPDLRAFTVPTLVVHGTDDKTVPIEATGRAAAREILGARLIEYDGAPHGVIKTHQARLTKDLLDFLGEAAPLATR